MFDFHLHVTRLSKPNELVNLLLEHQILFNAIGCAPFEWDILKDFKQICENKVGFFYGIHPEIASKITPKEFAGLKNILQNNSLAGIGECGLDKRFLGYAPGEIQEEIFKKQIELAVQLKRNLQIHCVGDYSRIVKILGDFEFDKTGCHVVFHRFIGDISTVKLAQKFNPLFSLHLDSFKKKSTLNSLLQIPKNQIRFETDLDESFFNQNPMDVLYKIKNQLTITEKMYHDLEAGVNL